MTKDIIYHHIPIGKGTVPIPTYPDWKIDITNTWHAWAHSEDKEFGCETSGATKEEALLKLSQRMEDWLIPKQPGDYSDLLTYRCWCGYEGTDPARRKHDNHLDWIDIQIDELAHDIATKQAQRLSRHPDVEKIVGTK
jgi:hypothetical protein